jgi:colanic acid/amylovoran biosynthesis protein
MEILSSRWSENVTAEAGVMASPTTVTDQQTGELDPRVKNFSVSQIGDRMTKKWWMAQANARLGTNFPNHTQDLAGHSKGSLAALQLGGDNYSLDYGRPWEYMAMDQFLQKRGIPVFIWGASIGPFDKDPEFAKIIYAHLKTLDGIFVRETATQTLMAENGITDNVHLVADPAFVMEKSAPEDASVRSLVADNPIGINISPLLSRFSDNGTTLGSWREKAAEMISAVAARLTRPILLIPHVASPKPDEDDYTFLESVRQKIGDTVSTPIRIAPPLGAAELKWLIGHCSAFAGARTHSTIAALSSHVPTLSLSYSIKSIGINQDIFGHQDFCTSVQSVTPDQFAFTIAKLVDQGSSIRGLLDKNIPEIQAKARSAGDILKDKLRTG